jgi:hypothetical protein
LNTHIRPRSHHLQNLDNTTPINHTQPLLRSKSRSSCQLALVNNICLLNGYYRIMTSPPWGFLLLRASRSETRRKTLSFSRSVWILGRDTSLTLNSGVKTSRHLVTFANNRGTAHRPVAF